MWRPEGSDLYSTTPSSLTAVVSEQAVHSEIERQTIWDGTFPCYRVAGRQWSADAMSRVDGMTHPTLRSKTTRISAAMGGSATSALFDLSCTAMSCLQVRPQTANHTAPKSINVMPSRHADNVGYHGIETPCWRHRVHVHHTSSTRLQAIVNIVFLPTEPTRVLRRL